MAASDSGVGAPGRPLVLAYSPCPNDTFIFHAWVHGRVPGSPPVEERLEDIDTLNQLALDGKADVVKVSMNAFERLRGRYALLHSGGALGRGCGPLVVAPKTSGLAAASDVRRVTALGDSLARAKVAVPGELTTAALLADLFAGGLGRPVVMPFDRIMPAVAAGEVDAGVIIHEGRFTYGSYGLRCLIDLGSWWEDYTGLPLPLGGIAVRRNLDREVKRAVDDAVRASVQLARTDPEASAEYVRAHSQEMDPLVCSQHIELYVNDFTVDYGDEGERAIRRLLGEAAALPAAMGERGAASAVTDLPGAEAPERAGVFWDD
jgi:1,4-dihydroxy-6-naphthoate synthase